MGWVIAFIVVFVFLGMCDDSSEGRDFFFGTFGDFRYRPKPKNLEPKPSLRERVKSLWYEFKYSSSDASVDNDGCDDGPRTSSNGW